MYSIKVLKKMGVELFPHANEKWKRKLWIEYKLTLGDPPTSEQQKEIDKILEDLTKLSPILDKAQFKEIEKQFMNQIKAIHEGYYNTIKPSLE